MTRSSPLRSLLVLLAGVVLVAAPSPVSAHSGVTSYVYVSLFDDGVEGRVEFPVADLGAVLGIDFPDDSDAALAAAQDRYDEIVAYTAANLDMRSIDGQSWQLEFGPEFGLLPAFAGNYLQVPFEVVDEFGEPPLEWITEYSGIIESNPERDALFLVEDDWRAGVFDNESDHLLGFSVGLEEQRIVIETVSGAESLVRVAQLGIKAVDRAADQLAAVVAVVAVAGLLGARRRDGAAPTIDECGVAIAQRIGLVITGAALATIVIGSAGIDVRTRVAGTCVALAVLLAAAMPWMPRRLLLPVSAGIGVLLGVDIGYEMVGLSLHRTNPVQSAVAFALGAVLVMALVAAMFTPMVLLLSRLRVAPRIATVVSVVIAAAGVVWMVERVLDLVFRLRTAELRIADAVTNPIVLAAVTVAVGAYVLTRSATSLRHGSGGADEPAATPDREKIGS